MEDFEVQSKQNRLKVLSGNSKALVEEEKYRKNGKRKYEQIVEKMTQAVALIQQLGGRRSASGLYVDITGIGQRLSSQGKVLLRGRTQVVLRK